MDTLSPALDKAERIARELGRDREQVAYLIALGKHLAENFPLPDDLKPQPRRWCPWRRTR